MNSFKAYFKKEVMEGIRSYKYLILGIGIIVFAILAPLILKMMPYIMKSQAPGMDISQLIQMTQKAALQNYMQNLFQISNLVIALALMGIFADEIKGKTFVMPYSKGIRVEGMVLAKIINYSIVIFVFSIIGFIINFYYSGILLGRDTLSFSQVMGSGFLFSVSLIFNFALISFMSSLFKKGIYATMASLGIIYTMPIFINIKAIHNYLPYYLVKEANLLADSFSSSVWIAVLWTLTYIILLSLGTIHRMKNIEVT